MQGRIEHVMINSNDYDRSRKFYAWLMPKIGFPETVTFDKPSAVTGWFHDAGSFWVQPADPLLRDHAYSKEKVGLREIAFAAESRAQVDALATEIEKNGGKILDPPREYDYTPGYYAVFFTDPDGIKLELVHRPSS